ncbi:DUF4832 domain-containing protein [Actinomyces wuliandei]|uniref:DUF4832 domain-containing protein n=1 Tax=Actinomyces wuliandei TaxID=2057743 RepID=UPI001FA9D60E|nr:DUF4832 domain-containing protein [Actinomyces wuliandei]
MTQLPSDGVPAEDPGDAPGTPGSRSVRALWGRVAARWGRRGGRRRAIVVSAVSAVVVAVLLAAGLRACLPLGAWEELPRAAAPTANPLKGMLPYAPQDPQADPELSDSALPHTMEWLYLPLSDVVTGPGTYDWTALESHLEAVAARGHHTVLRFYMDFPGRSSGIPRYLVEDGLATTRSYTFYHNGAQGSAASVSPDYNDPDTMEMLTGFVSAFGERYDGDPRLGFVTQGLVGFWGEGHTWPMDGTVSSDNPRGEDWMASEANQKTLVEAWDEAFDTTPTQVRYPTSWSASHDVGYHDDSFGYATLDTTDWHFMALMRAAGTTQAWQTQPIGGEVYPGIQDCVLTDPDSCGSAQDAAAGHNAGHDIDLAASVQATHATWLLDDWVFTGDMGERERGLAAESSASTGYELAATRWRARGSEVEVELVNDGVAPFYYDWQVEAVVLDSGGTVVGRTPLDGDLREVLPGTAVTFSGELDVPGEQATVLLRVVNPLEGGAPLRLANAGQDQDLEGYLTLGHLGPTGSVLPEKVEG